MRGPCRLRVARTRPSTVSAGATPVTVRGEETALTCMTRPTGTGGGAKLGAPSRGALGRKERGEAQAVVLRPPTRGVTLGWEVSLERLLPDMLSHRVGIPREEPLY